MAVSRKIGKGRVLYVGTYLTEELTAALADRTFAEAGIEPLLVDLPNGVEVTMRENGHRRLLFIQNCLDGKTELKKVPAGRNLLENNAPVTGSLSLDGYGCAIVELD